MFPGSLIYIEASQETKTLIEISKFNWTGTKQMIEKH